MKDSQFWKSVSRETLEKLSIYERLLRKWQPSLNLIANSTLDDIWNRHFLDSAQLYSYTKDFDSIACLGSGAGFPGAVLSILGHSNAHLIERDQKKSVFLRTVARETGSKFTIVNDDICNHIGKYSCVVSRALATVNDLLELSEQISVFDTEYFFLKGVHVDQELTDALKIWGMTDRKIKSITDNNGVVLHLKAVKRL